VPPDLDGRRLDAAVKQLFDVPWGQARSWIRGGKLAANEVVVTEGAHPVAAGDRLRYTAAARRPRPDTELPPDVIVYEDRYLVVVDKPAGLSSVPYEEHERGALTSRVQALLGRRAAASGTRRRGMPPPMLVVHRLDRDTSGLLVFVRLPAAVEPLAAQFRDHRVHRRYLALVHGEARTSTYRSHLLPDRGDGRRGSRERVQSYRLMGKGAGRLAVTHTEVVERLPGATLLACRLETGRTHQIRIHLAEAGHPLVGEKVYVPRHLVVELPRKIPAPRMLLHAAELGFDHPVTGAPLHFQRPPPADMVDVLERLRARRPAPP
jgi:23S rRNA pseudouridine1911/1915/1917 synthase